MPAMPGSPMTSAGIMTWGLKRPPQPAVGSRCTSRAKKRMRKGAAMKTGVA